VTPSVTAPGGTNLSDATVMFTQHYCFIGHQTGVIAINMLIQ